MIERVSIPISTCLRRAEFLRHCLGSLARTSTRAHEVVLVTEDDPDEVRVLAEALSRGPRAASALRVRVVQARPILDGHNPVYEFLDLGILAAREEWVMTPAGDDSYFPPGWERLLEAVDPAERLRSIWVPRYLAVLPSSNRPYGYREKAGTQDGIRFHEFRLSPGPDSSIAESDVVAEAASLREERVARELAGERFEVSWPHAVMSRALIASAGLYEMLPPFPASHDLRLHERLGARGITAVGVFGAVIVNSRSPVRLGE